MKKPLSLAFLALAVLLCVSTPVLADDPNRKDLIDAFSEPENFQDQVRFLAVVPVGIVILDPTCTDPLEANVRR